MPITYPLKHVITPYPYGPCPAGNLTRFLYQVHTQSPLGGGVGSRGSREWFVYTWQRLFRTPNEKKIQRWGINYIPTHTCHNSIPVWQHMAGYLTRFLYSVHTQSPLGRGVGSGGELGVVCICLAKTLPYSDRKQIQRRGINYIPTHTCHNSIPICKHPAGYLTCFCTEYILNHHLAEECRVGVWVVHTWQRLFRILIEKEFEGGVSITFPLKLVITPYPYGHTRPGISLASYTENIPRCYLAEEGGLLHTVDGS